MAKRFVIRELEPLEIVFNDQVLTCLLNNDALMLLDETFGDIQKLLESEKGKPFDLAAKLLFCGVKLHDTSFDYETAKKIITSGGLSLTLALVENFVENFKINATEEQLEVYTGELERLLKTLG